jgi:hypothetical protein
MKRRALHVFIIESAKDDGEAKLLEEKLAGTRISIRVRVANNKKAFLSALRSGVIHFIAHRASFPVLHISAHGCEKGIGLSNYDFIGWDEFGAAIGTQLSDRLILCMSTCQGLRSWGMALMENSPHYLLLVGTEEKPRWNDTKAGFPAFYQSLAQGKTIDEAIDNLRTISGHSHFMIVPGPLVNQIRQEVVDCKTPDEVHEVRDKYGLPSRRHQRFSPVYPFRLLSSGDYPAKLD